MLRLLRWDCIQKSVPRDGIMLQTTSKTLLKMLFRTAKYLVLFLINLLKI